MYKLSEVCRKIGVTRRTLQGYNELGLVKPSAKTEAGYWLYDEEAIGKLAIIQEKSSSTTNTEMVDNPQKIL